MVPLPPDPRAQVQERPGKALGKSSVTSIRDLVGELRSPRRNLDTAKLTLFTKDRYNQDRR